MSMKEESVLMPGGVDCLAGSGSEDKREEGVDS